MLAISNLNDFNSSARCSKVLGVYLFLQMPSEPVEFSYWVAGNLPLDDSMKLHLLRIDSAIQRLRCELNIMQKVQLICHENFTKNLIFCEIFHIYTL